MRDPAARSRDPRLPRGRERLYRARSRTRAPLQEALFAEMKARLKQDDSTVPPPTAPSTTTRPSSPAGNTRALPPPARGGAETVLLDGNAEAEDSLLGSRRHRPQPRPQAPGLRHRRQGLGALHHPLRDLATGRGPSPTRSPTRAAIVWANDGATLFYIRLDANQRPLFVYRHGSARRCGRRSSTPRTTWASTSASARPSPGSSS